MPIFNNARMGASSARTDEEGLIKSLRFNKDDDSSLVRSFGTATNTNKWSVSFWVKRCEFTEDSFCFSAGGASFIGFTGAFFVWSAVDQGGVGYIKTNLKFRDCASWYHVVCVADTDNSTADERMQVYINGIRLSNVAGEFSSYTAPVQNQILGFFNDTGNHRINRRSTNGDQEENFYLADMYFVDGHARGPTYFGEYDSNGTWQRKRYDGVFGNNGFHLFDFANVTGVGDDASGKNNNWTPSNFTTSGTGTDILYDVPQNGDQTDSGNGGEVSGNYATLDPNNRLGAILSEGNLKITASASSGYGKALSTIWFDPSDSDGIYAEFTLTGSGTSPAGVGLQNHYVHLMNSNQGNPGGYYLAALNTSGGIWATKNGTQNQTVDEDLSVASGDVIGIAVKNNKIYFAINGTWWGNSNPATESNPEFSNVTDHLAFCCAANSTNSLVWTANFGQRPFEYSAPSGFKTLNTKSLASLNTIGKGDEYFDAKTYSGSDDDKSITYNFSPDIVWIKKREEAYWASDPGDHVWADSQRGNDKILYVNKSDTEATLSSQITSFDNDGFTVNGNQSDVNNNGREYVAWAWDVGDSTPQQNTDGELTTTVKHNQTAGVSIVRWTGDEKNRSLGHGLGAVPDLILLKNLDTAENWCVYHHSVTSKRFLEINDTTNLQNSNQDQWQRTDPTSSVFYVGRESQTNGDGDEMVAYCFVQKPGYCKIDSYFGRGGYAHPMVWTGFKPAFVLIKNADELENWMVYDSTRDPFNAASKYLMPNLDDEEVDNSNYEIDILSNGFKIKSTRQSLNGYSDKMVYIAIAEHPFTANGGISR